MKPKKIKVSIKRPISIREKVYGVLRNDILKGRFAPGERIVEARLAEQVKASRTPIREALHSLEKEGLLECIPRVGYRVKEISWKELEEICEIRKVNEILAAKWAMRRIKPSEMRTLEQNLSVSDVEIRRGRPGSFIERDADFHEILVRASGSERLLGLCQQLRCHMLRYRRGSLRAVNTAMEANKGHRRILDCLRKKDEQGVEKAIEDHLEFAKRSIHSTVFREDS